MVQDGSNWKVHTSGASSGRTLRSVRFPLNSAAFAVISHCSQPGALVAPSWLHTQPHMECTRLQDLENFLCLFHCAGQVSYQIVIIFLSPVANHLVANDHKRVAVHIMHF